MMRRNTWLVVVGLFLAQIAQVAAQPCGYLRGEAVGLDEGYVLLKFKRWSPEQAVPEIGFSKVKGLELLGAVRWKSGSGDTLYGQTMAVLHPQVPAGSLELNYWSKGGCLIAPVQVLRVVVPEKWGIQVRTDAAPSSRASNTPCTIAYTVTNSGNTARHLRCTNTSGEVHWEGALDPGELVPLEVTYGFEEVMELRVFADSELDTTILHHIPVLRSATERKVLGERDLSGSLISRVSWSPDGALRPMVAHRLQIEHKQWSSRWNMQQNVLHGAVGWSGRRFGTSAFLGRSLPGLRLYWTAGQHRLTLGNQFLGNRWMPQGSWAFHGAKGSVQLHQIGSALRGQWQAGGPTYQLWGSGSMQSGQFQNAALGGRNRGKHLGWMGELALQQVEGRMQPYGRAEMFMAFGGQRFSYEFGVPSNVRIQERHRLRGTLAMGQFHAGFMGQREVYKDYSTGQYQLWGQAPLNRSWRMEYRGGYRELVRGYIQEHSGSLRYVHDDRQLWVRQRWSGGEDWTEFSVQQRIFGQVVRLESTLQGPRVQQVRGTLVWVLGKERWSTPLTGQITHEGKPVAGVVLRCDGEEIITDAQGMYRFGHLSGKTSVVVDVSSLPFGTALIGPPEQNVNVEEVRELDFSLASTHGIHGRVLAHGSGGYFGTVVPWNKLWVAVYNDSTGQALMRLTVDENGSFSCSGLPEGSYSMEVRGGGKYWSSERIKNQRLPIINNLIINIYEKDNDVVYTNIK